MIKFTFLLHWSIVVCIWSNYGVAGQISNPMKDPNICGRPICEVENEKFRFKSDSLYKYVYTSSVQTLFEGAESNVSELFVSANVEVMFPTKCQGTLKLTGVKLSNMNGKAEVVEEKNNEYEDYDDEDSKSSDNTLHSKSRSFSDDIERYDVRFSFQDGVMQEICPNKHEQTWVTNFKRGILSSFQNTMFRFDLDHSSIETDVSGKCEVSYTLVGAEGTSLVIKKVKDISSCIHRYRFNSFIQTKPYEFRRNDISWWPIFNSTSYCTISIDNYIYNKIECNEYNILIPFSNNQSGAVTKTKTNLKFASETLLSESSRTDSDETIDKRQTLLYDHSFSAKPTHGEIKFSREYLKQMCRLGFPNIQREFPDNFVKFLTASKQLSIGALQQLLNRAGSICANGKKHVLESLPYIGSTASVILMKDMIIKNTVDPEMVEIWMHSLFYLPSPEEETIDAMFSLIEHRNNNRNPMFVLIPTSVVHTYCVANINCNEKSSVMRIIKYLEGVAVKNLAGDLSVRTAYEDLIVALKGLGNIGIITKNFEQILKDTIVDPLIIDDVRLQAINVFRRLHCEKSRDYFMDIFKNETQSVEVRTASYLQQMKCPTYLTIKMIKHVLTIEKVNQVGSFVWSHLNNMAKSAAPTYVELQGLLADNQLDSKFNLDFRKFSKNNEYSLFFDEYNFGVTAESNVIFGTESYLPRSFSFNGTINLFGVSVNAFEFNVRMQGFELYVESIFGLKGPLNLNRIMDKFGFIYKYFKNIFHNDEVDNEEDIYNDNTRKRRDVKELSNNIENIPFKQTYEFNHPNGYFEYKIFGNDINIYTFDGFDEFSDILRKLISLEQLKSIFSNRDEVFIKSGTLFDVGYTVPLSSGFPLTLNGLGAYSLDLQYFGAIKNENIWETKSIDFSGKFRPSLSMEMNGKMQVDLFYASTDIKLKTNLFTNYAIETDLLIKDTQLVSLKVKLPKERNDIFSVRSQLIANKESEEIQLKGIQNRYINSSCTWPSIDDAIGLKICIDYSLPDVSALEKTYPSLLFSGPVIFDIHLDKADPTAKIFIFEYSWKKYKGSSEGSLIFETPDSKVPRHFSANVITDSDYYNFTMGFKNGENVHSAIGVFKSKTDDKRVDLSIHINDKKHFSMELSLLKKKTTKNRSVMYPRFMLIINDQEIAGMVGTIKMNDKNNITQYDVDLQFETKRMQSSAVGYVLRTETSLTTKMQYAYKFAGGKSEQIEIDTELSNKSQRTRGRVEYNGSAKLVSSAYPYLNFAGTSMFLTSLGHIETRIDINNAPDLIDPAYTLTTKFSLARQNENTRDSRTIVSIEVLRPKSLTEYKFYVKHDERYKNGTEHDIFATVRYSPKKEIVGTASLLFPKGSLVAIDAAFNLTIPDMNSCFGSVKVKEKVKNEYYVDLFGEWFSGQNIKVVGRYQDRTSSVKRFHHLKSIISSNTFDDLTFDFKYSRDFHDLKFNIQSDYKKKLFALEVKSSDFSVYESQYSGELKWADQQYSIFAHSSSKDVKKTTIEVHFDRIRDMHLEFWGGTGEFKKTLGVEFKWDANRDPSQKFLMSCEYNNPQPKSYNGDFLIGYPDRTLNGKFDVITGPNYDGNLRLSWSADEVIDMGYSIGSELKDSKRLWTHLKVDTPFSGWRNNNVNASLYQNENLVKMYFGSMWADNQKIGIDLMIDYSINDTEFSCELKTDIDSTIKDIPVINAYFKHLQDNERFDTDVSIKHKNVVSDQFRQFAVKSGWKYNTDGTFRNVSGSIRFRSPFERYISGALITKFSLNKDKQLFGVVDVDVENRLYSLSLGGYMKKIFDNSININITTPYEAFPYLNARFGVNEREKHLVADMQTLNRSLGIEVLLDFNSITDFDVKFYVAIPLEAFEKILMIGKIKDDILHIEGAFGKINLGFKGVWSYISVKQFEYSYQIFTPLSHFEENGLVTRMIYNNAQNFDMECSFKLGKYKLGLKGFGKPKKQLIINQLGIQKATYLRDEFFEKNELESEEKSNESGMELDMSKFFSLMGTFEINTIVWTTITVNYDIQQIDDTYHGLAKVKTPLGFIEIKNKLTMVEDSHYKNQLKIDTPFPSFKTISSNYKFEIPSAMPGIYVRFDVGINDKDVVSTYGFKLKYLIPKNTSLETHDLSLNILIPLMDTTSILVTSKLETNRESIYKIYADLSGFQTDLMIKGLLDSNNENFDASFGLTLKSPIIPHYSMKTVASKSFLNDNHLVTVGFNFEENDLNSNFTATMNWKDDGRSLIDGNVAITSNIFPIKNFYTSLNVVGGEESKFNMSISYKPFNYDYEHIKFLIARKDNDFEGEIQTPLSDYNLIRFNGMLNELSEPYAYNVKGQVYRNAIPYNFDGKATIVQYFPTDVNLKIKIPRDADAVLQYKFLKSDSKQSITLELKKSSAYVSLESEIFMQNKMDWAYNVKISSSRPEIDELKLSTSLTPVAKNRYDSSFEMISPWKKYFIDKVNVSTQLTLAQQAGDVKLNYGISQFVGTSGCNWKWLSGTQRQDYLFHIYALPEVTDDVEKSFETEFKYTNSTESFTDASFKININSLWTINTSAKIALKSMNDISMNYFLDLPPPLNDGHTVVAQYKIMKNPSAIDCELNYENTKMMLAKLKTKGTFRDFANMNNIMKLQWGNSTEPLMLQSDFNVKKIDKKTDFTFELESPLYDDEKTVDIKGSYDTKDFYHIIRANLSVPESRLLTYTDVAFADMKNSKGILNCSLPAFNISWLHLDFDLSSQDEETVKYIKASWPENHAVLDSKSTLVIQDNQKDWKGTIKAEIPLQTKHQALISYGLSEKPLITTGHASVEYNENTVLNSQYTCKSETTADSNKEVVDLILQNNFKPVGMHYVNERRKNAANKEEFNKKHVEIFDLHKKDRFNITGEFIVESIDNQQKYKLIAIHPNRTIIISSDYLTGNDYTNHSCKVELAPTVWIGFNIDIKNQSTDNIDSKEMKFLVSYPTRDVTALGSYVLTTDSFDTDVQVSWHKSETVDNEFANEDDEEITPKNPKQIHCRVQWKNHDLVADEIDHQTILLGLKHPSFEKDVILKGLLYRSTVEVLKTEIEFEYADDEDQLAKFTTVIRNLTNEVGYKNYTFQITGVHVATELNLLVDGSVCTKPNIYKFETKGTYKRSYLDIQDLETFGFIDSENKKVKFFRSTPNQIIDIYGSSAGSFPKYKFEMIFQDEPDYDTKGELILDLMNKMITANVNLTSDASQSLQVQGHIPDTRSAVFNVWRNYDDIRISDITYFMQMNHSRLISSRLTWRPKMRKEIKDGIRQFISSRYNALAEDVDYWVITVYNEMVETIKGVLDESKSHTQEFLEDLSGLKDIDEDLTTFRNFLNASYHADEFYVQSFVNFTLTVLDELAITDHLQTIPKILKEIWQVLGESGEAFRKSILWIIETVKGSYNDSLEVFSHILNGNSLEHVTKFFETLIDKYDRFVKDVHISFIKYIEGVWDNFTRMMAAYWNRLLQNFEPQLIRTMHYFESVVWSVSKEVFDFLYNRTNEIIESPYFHKVSDLTHDLDLLYQDLKTNDIFTNTRKYSILTWQFLKEKIFNIIPFGKEMQDLFSELTNEIRTLQKIESVQYAMEKYVEIETKTIWLMNEFQLEKRLNKLWEIAKKKLARITQNALQTDDVYREAKTKFVFDPDVGSIVFEQKLPMAWHAFNETPKFGEIPEYKLLMDVQSFFLSKKNTSFWSIYYELKPYSEPHNFIPPFNSHALLIGSKHIITFDQDIVSFDNNGFNEIHNLNKNLDDQCSYLLANDFVGGNFSLVLQPNIIKDNNRQFLAKKLILFTDDTKIEIFLGSNSQTLKIGDNEATALPTSFKNTVVSREMNMIIVESKRGFLLKCNLEFDVCSFELSGWYFGKIAGLMGTMNNEKYDDFMKSDNQLATTETEFVDSWKMFPKCNSLTEETPNKDLASDLLLLCDSFFKKKTSYFSTCYSLVDSEPFYKMCLNVGSSSRYETSDVNREKGACIVAISYIESCAVKNVPLRIPDNCIHCQLNNGTLIAEGSFVTLKNEAIPQAADIVFIVEAKQCNSDLIKRKGILTLASTLNAELKKQNILFPRYAVLAFGGSAEYDKATSIVVNGDTFTGIKNLPMFLNHLKTGNGSSDIMTAITAAISMLSFTPGASKIFILLPCSECSSKFMKFDYSSVIQLLTENVVNLHILSDHNLTMNKKDKIKVLGFDRMKAYTKKDQKVLSGDVEKRQQVRVPKSSMGMCIRLALETDGSMFSSKGLAERKNDNDMKILSNVFSKRIAQTARPSTCQVCECQGHNSGQSYMTCLNCHDAADALDYDEADDSLLFDETKSYEVQD